MHTYTHAAGFIWGGGVGVGVGELSSIHGIDLGIAFTAYHKQCHDTVGGIKMVTFSIPYCSV